MRKISITEALNELKLYDSKITKAINNTTFCGAAKKSSDKVGVVNMRVRFQPNGRALCVGIVPQLFKKAQGQGQIVSD